MHQSTVVHSGIQMYSQNRKSYQISIGENKPTVLSDR